MFGTTKKTLKSHLEIYSKTSWLKCMILKNQKSYIEILISELKLTILVALYNIIHYTVYDVGTAILAGKSNISICILFRSE